MKTLTAMIAVCGLALASASAPALAGGSRDRAENPENNYTLSQRKPQVRGYLFRPGGHRYDYESEPFLRRNGPYGNYPNFDPRTFKERVFSDPRDNSTSPSAF